MSKKISPPPPVKGLPSLDMDGLIHYIKTGKAQNILVLTGAGTSVSAGIPDFRSKGGLYESVGKYNLPYPEAVFTIEYFDKDPGPFYDVSKTLLPGAHKPVVAHYFVTLLARHNILLKLYTQNIDSLDREAGVPDDKIIEAHGSYAKLHCRKCGHEYVYHDYYEDFKNGVVPHCKECGDGVIKPDIVFYGEGLPEEFFNVDEDAAKADLLIVMGTSLTVSPCNTIPGLVGKDVPRVLINRDMVATYGEKIKFIDKEPFDAAEKNHKECFKFGHKLNRRDIFLKGDCDDVCRAIIDALGWTDELEAMMRSYK